MKDDIACVVLNYNDSSTTIDYILFIRKLNLYKYIIVIDNKSTDDSFYKIKKYEDEVVKIYTTPRNGGYGYGNNYGVKIAAQLGCKLAVISNPDVRYESQVISNIVSFMIGQEVTVAAPCQYSGHTKKAIKGIAWEVPTYNSYVFGALYLIKRLMCEGKYDLHDEYVKVDCVPGALLIVKVEDFLAVGGYDERVFLYCEESILGFRFKRAGYKTYLAVKQKYFHYESSTIKKSISSIYKRQEMIYENRLFYLKEYLKVNVILLFMAKTIYKIALAETWLKGVVEKEISRK